MKNYLKYSIDNYQSIEKIIDNVANGDMDVQTAKYIINKTIQDINNIELSNMKQIMVEKAEKHLESIKKHIR